MTTPAPGTGGLQPPPQNAPPPNSNQLGVQPGTQNAIDIAQIVIIYGPAGVITGLFLYAGTPSAGNLIGSWSNTSGVDKWGNPYPAGLSVGNNTFPQVQIGALATGTSSGISFPTNTADNIPAAGANLGLLYSFVANSGLVNQQIGLLLQGPSINDTGFAGDINGFSAAMYAGADDGSAPASLQIFDTFGTPFLTFTNNGGTSPEMFIGQNVTGTQAFITCMLNGVILDYGTAGGGTVVKTFNANGTMVFPTGITHARVQNWASGAGGQWASGPGGGSGEYAEEPSLAVTAGLTYTATVPTGGNGGTSSSGTGKSGATAIFAQGATQLVVAHGAPVNNTNPSTGGTGSAATIHWDGGGCNSASGAGDGGGGGGGAPTATAAGFPGHHSTGSTAGGGGAGPGASGGNGGQGGSSPKAGGNGAAPGAGGGSGGASSASGANGGNGGAARIIVTYTVPGGTALQSALASAAGTDASGNDWAAGYTGPVSAVQPGSSPSNVETWHSFAGSYQNSWTAFSGRDLCYQLTSEGGQMFVHLTGRIVSPSGVASPSVAATLPVGYRPLNRNETVHAENIGSAGTTFFNTYVEINTSGQINVYGAPGAGSSIAIGGRFALNAPT